MFAEEAEYSDDGVSGPQVHPGAAEKGRGPGEEERGAD